MGMEGKGERKKAKGSLRGLRGISKFLASVYASCDGRRKAKGKAKRGGMDVIFVRKALVCSGVLYSNVGALPAAAWFLNKLNIT